MSKRHYVVTEKSTGTRRLVKAASQSQAINHVVRGIYDAAAATPDDIVALMGEGVRPETAGEAGAE